MTVTLDSFRAAFPEFAAPTYPDGSVSYQIALAGRLVGQGQWGELYDDGVMLLAAHNLAMAPPPSSVPGAPRPVVGAPVGILSGKSVGPVSKSYDTSVGLDTDAGLYGATSYGRRYYQLLRLIGAGGVQL